MNLLLEFRAQFSLREWLCAMKQLIHRLLLGYRPNPKAYTPTGKVRTIDGGTFQEKNAALLALHKYYEMENLKQYQNGN